MLPNSKTAKVAGSCSVRVMLGVGFGDGGDNDELPFGPRFDKRELFDGDGQVLQRYLIV